MSHEVSTKREARRMPQPRDQQQIGSRADIEKVPATSLKRFYKKYYRPDNAVLVVAGKFDAPAALNLISTHFSPVANPPAPIEPTYTPEPVQDGERVVSR